VQQAEGDVLGDDVIVVAFPGFLGRCAD